MKNKMLWGLAMGAAAGAGLEMALRSRKGQVKRAVGRTMEDVGAAMNTAADTIDSLASQVKR